MSRTPSTRGLLVVVVAAAGLVGFGAALAFRPAAVIGVFPALESALVVLDPAQVVIAIALALLVCVPMLVVSGRFGGNSPKSMTDDVGRRDRRARRGRAPTQSRRTAGADFDTFVETATAYDEHPRWKREEARERLVETLRPIAADAYAARTGCQRTEAMAAIRDGSWTDDPRAAAFLADETGPSTPLVLWLYDLLSAADPFSRGIERVIVEVEAVQSEVRQ